MSTSFNKVPYLHPGDVAWIEVSVAWRKQSLWLPVEVRGENLLRADGVPEWEVVPLAGDRIILLVEKSLVRVRRHE